jgi:hypothetical protein
VKVVRIALALCAAALVPACSRSLHSGAMLFNEGFNGSFPGTAWTTPAATGTGTSTQVNSSAGSPTPALRFTTTGAGSSSRTETTTAFNSQNVTISAQMAILTATPALEGTGAVAILDATPAVVASAAWDNAAGTVTFSITGTTATVPAPAADGNFHTFAFSVDGTGTARWTLDNGPAALAKAGFPSGMLKIELSGTFGAGTAWPSIFVDNVAVTSP